MKRYFIILFLLTFCLVSCKTHTLELSQEKKEIILYTYFNVSEQEKFTGLKLARWINNDIELFDFANNKENIHDNSISFTSLFHGKKYMITYGISNNTNIEKIKLLYNDNKYLEDCTKNSGYLIIRNNYTDGVNQILALDKNSNIVYKFPK